MIPVPSAMLCAHPCQPPTRIGPKRAWMWALIFRSHQMRNMATTEMNPMIMLTTTNMISSLGTSHGIPHAAKTA